MLLDVQGRALRQNIVFYNISPEAFGRRGKNCFREKGERLSLVGALFLSFGKRWSVKNLERNG